MVETSSKENKPDQSGTGTSQFPKAAGFRDVLGILILAAVYSFAGTFGLSLAFINPSASAVWPPTGIALAALLLFGLRLWPGVFIGAFVVNFVTQHSVLTALGVATGNTLESVAGAWLVSRFADGPKAFESAGGAVRFLLLAGLGSTLISATMGVTTLSLRGFVPWKQYGAVWLTWWLGDVISDVIIAPFILIWGTQPIRRIKPAQALEAAALLLTVAVVAQIVFPSGVPIRDKNIPLGYWMLLPLLWAAFRFGPRGAITAAFLSSMMALWGTLRGLGPFVKDSLNLSILFVQTFVGTITGTALILAAINAERQRAEEMLRQSEEGLRRHKEHLEEIVAERTGQLTETVQELESFSYSIAHDMRAPLRSMQGFGNILLEDFSDRLGDEGKDYVRRIKSSAARLDHMIRDVLDYSRTVRGQTTLEQIDLDQLVEDIIHTYPNLNAHLSNIKVERPLPAVIGNTAALTQVMSNLLGNAVKFVEPGQTPLVRVRSEVVRVSEGQSLGGSERQGVKASGRDGQVASATTSPRSDAPHASPCSDAQDGAFIRLWVEDNGIGIAAESRERIFGMFQRLNRPDLYEGTGMGLAIVRKAVERMGGRIGVESALGKGSRFWVELKGAAEKVK